MTRTSTATAPEHKTSSIINHIVLLLDGSTSMVPHASGLIKVADNQIAHLAERSRVLDQETRISVFIFSSAGMYRCLIWDKDVLRLPSISALYKASGNTALVDATLDCIRDLRETPERYGDHSFLLFALSDGEENDSLRDAPELKRTLDSLPDNWTIAALVPNARAMHEAKRFGFPAGNVEIWDASNTRTGTTEAGQRFKDATESFMQARATGVRSTRTLFATDLTVVNAATVSANLVPLDQSKYSIVPIPSLAQVPASAKTADGKNIVIKPFAESCGFRYQVGHGFYELTKPEKIQPQKSIMIMERKGQQRVFHGREARQLVGLPDNEVRVKPDFNPEYRIFVQSNAINRHLMPGTQFLYLNN